MNLCRSYYDMLRKSCAKWPSSTAVSVYNEGKYDTYTYSEIYGVCEYISHNIQLLKTTQGLVGIVSSKNIIIPSVIAAVHKHNNAFMFLRSIEELNEIKCIQCKLVITIQYEDETTDHHKADRTIKIFNLIISFYKQDNNEEIKNLLNEYSYFVQTSGSTGKPKCIQVPVKCLQPNIKDFTKLFNVTSKDVIYLSTPLTFDPSMIEILLACQNGASLLIAPENVDILFPNMHQYITIWQITPSKFLQYSDVQIKRILSENSTLKILAFGGEPFLGVNKIRDLKDKLNKTRIFSLYGVTEMSCWACATELNVHKHLNNEVTLGKCLSQTKLQLQPFKGSDNIGSIILESKSRKCLILNNGVKTFEEYIDTGDLGEIINGNLYYRGRKDDVIKRFGSKVNLQIIEATAMGCQKINCCSCLWIQKTMLLVMYFSSKNVTSVELAEFLRHELEHRYLPDKIIRIKNIPVNKHGKICKSGLLKLYENSLPVINKNYVLKDTFDTAFINELKSTLNLELCLEDIKEKEFFSIGGTSFLAVMLCNRLSVSYPEESKSILPHLLSQYSCLGNILDRVQNRDGSKRLKKIKVRKRNRSAEKNKIESLKKIAVKVNKTIYIENLWKFDTGKCVDASPAIYKSNSKIYVTVGSHSGKLVSLEVLTGKPVSIISMTSRIEASVCLFDNSSGLACGVAGTYNGTVICYCIENCSVLWIINIGMMIKSKAVFLNDMIYIAAYDGYIRCFDALDGKLLNQFNISKQAISSDLVLAKENILAGSLAGECASLHVGPNTVVWKKCLSSPIFGSPLVYDDDKYVIYAEVNGRIHCFSVDEGVEMWKYTDVIGNIFSSLTIKMQAKNSWNIFFGCHDHHVYNLLVNKFVPTLIWRLDLQSPVYSTPNILFSDMLIAVSTKGKMCFIDAAKGSILHEYFIDGEVFSSPAVYEDRIFVGCRNDNLYCLQFNEK